MKPQTATQLRDREIKLIHVARRELGLDEETYRAMLQQVAGVESSAELTWQGRKKVLDHFKAKGFKVKSKAAPGKAAKPDPDADAQYRKIRALWTELHDGGVVRVNTDAAVRVYIKRMTGCDDYRFCNGAQVVTVIEGLKKWIGRIDRSAAAAATAAEVPHG
ncbi:MAG: regulatory protein GemA [Oxalobacteraceae bacterium]|nr:regulatory protein GemA [Oxalobacteraceae bacterium]